MVRKLFIALIFLLASTCLLADETSDVLAKNQQYYEAFSRLDMQMMSEVWWHGSEVTNMNPQTLEIVQGWNNVRAHWERTMSGLDSMSVRMVAPHVVIHEGTARVIGTTEFTRKPGGQAELTGRALATNVFEKRGGRWYLVHHHATQIP